MLTSSASLPASDLMSSSELLSGAKTQNKAQDALWQKAQEFEAVFLKEMMQTMFTGLEDGGTYGNSEGSEAWRSMLLNEYASEVSKSGGIGLAASLHTQLLQLQESSQ